VTVGAGFWIFYSLGVALITQMLPSASDRGKDLGVINVASTLPQIIMPPLGAVIINTLGLTHPAGYLLLFGAGAAAVAGALLLMRGLPRR
jgi:MFS family permease